MADSVGIPTNGRGQAGTDARGRLQRLRIKWGTMSKGFHFEAEISPNLSLSLQRGHRHPVITSFTERRFPMFWGASC